MFSIDKKKYILMVYWKRGLKVSDWRGNEGWKKEKEVGGGGGKGGVEKGQERRDRGRTREERS